MSQSQERENIQMVTCPHCGTRMRVPTAVVDSNVMDWPCVRCHRRFPPR